MKISRELAASLGFPKPHYLNIERERRWICGGIPEDRVSSVEEITDLYVSGSRLRLREARPIDGSAALLRISRKVDADARTRLISSVYLSEADYEALAHSLTGDKITKLRYLLRSPQGIPMCIDKFLGNLSGLLILEAEFEDDEALETFSPPECAEKEITDDDRYSGYMLATRGWPAGDDAG